MNVDSLNRVRPDTRPASGRNAASGRRRITFYYTDNDRLLILGQTDEGVFWVSETDLNDEETNAAVFDRVASITPASFQQLYTVFITHRFERGSTACYYHASLHSADGSKTSLGGDIVWETPFGHCYVRDQERYNGGFFARDVRRHREKLRAMCRWRLAEGAYLGLMRRYLEILSDRKKDPVEDYDSKRELIELIHSESYLLCTEDREALELYLRLDALCSVLYNEYMSVVR